MSELESRVPEGLLNDLTEIGLAEREGWGEWAVQKAVERLKEKYGVHTLPGLGAKAREEGYGARE